MERKDVVRTQNFIQTHEFIYVKAGEFSSHQRSADQLFYGAWVHHIFYTPTGLEYTSYFALQQVLNELLEAGLIRVHTNHNMSRYEITKEGEDTLEFFGKNISPAIIDDMDQYLKKNRFRIRNEAGIISDFYKSTNQDYIVHCEVREGKTVLLDLSISVPDRDQAESMCSQWEKKNQEIYAYVMKT